MFGIKKLICEKAKEGTPYTQDKYLLEFTAVFLKNTISFHMYYFPYNDWGGFFKISISYY